MYYQYHNVSQQISDYVRTTLIVSNSKQFTNSDLPLIAYGMPALVCVTNEKINVITICRNFVLEERSLSLKNTTIFIFYFKPFLLNTVFNISAKALREKDINLCDIFAQQKLALDVQLFHSPTDEQKLGVLINFIQVQIQRNQKVCHIIKFATDRLLQDNYPEIIAETINELNLTERTFQRIFKKYVGITAIEYKRICQFNSAFWQLKSGHYQKLIEVAYDNSYFDQSHFVRTFKKYTKTTPNEYLKHGLSKKE